MSNTENKSDSKPKQSAVVRLRYTWQGRLTWAVLDLVIAYIFGSMAVNSGSLWQWGIAVLFLINGAYNIVRCIGRLQRGNSNG